MVPPPPLNADSLPDISLNAYQDALGLDTFSHEKLVKHNAMLEWTYERRREAQMILPYLYLGPLAAVKDEAGLKREGITCVLAVRQTGAFQSRLLSVGMAKAEQMGAETRAVDVVDNQDLIHSFPRTTAQIRNHVVQRLQSTGDMGKVLVFCESGNERSAAVVAAYLMETYAEVDHIKAMQVCQAQRFCVNFDDSLKRLLQGYWDILCAKRQVALNQRGHNIASDNNGVGSTPGRGKRTLERDMNEDEEMDGTNDDDLARFGGRQFAPFVDQPL